MGHFILFSNPRKANYLFIFLTFLISIMLSCSGWVKIRRSWLGSELPLAIRWEGLYHDKNFRDIGASINQCYGEPVMRPGRVFRSSGWFSGWDCSKVGNPQVIYTLNFNPKEKVFFLVPAMEKKNSTNRNQVHKKAFNSSFQNDFKCLTSMLINNYFFVNMTNT